MKKEEKKTSKRRSDPFKIDGKAKTQKPAHGYDAGELSKRWKDSFGRDQEEK